MIKSSFWATNMLEIISKEATHVLKSGMRTHHLRVGVVVAGEESARPRVGEGQKHQAEGRRQGVRHQRQHATHHRWHFFRQTNLSSRAPQPKCSHTRAPTG